MALNPTTWGPKYWADNFGYDDFDSFADDASKYVDGFGFLGITLPDELTLRDAWYFPSGGVGAYIAVRLRAAGQPIESESTGQTLGSVIAAAIAATPGGPMGQLVIPGAFQVSIQMVSGGRQIVNVIGLINASGSAAGAAAAVKAAWEAVGGPLQEMSSLVAMTNYHAVDIGSGSGLIVDLASTKAGGVTSPADLATRGAAALIKLNGGSRDRSTRGRLYYGPIREADLQADGATLQATRVTAFNGVFTVFRNSLTAAGYPMAVLSRTKSVATPVTSHLTESTIATQRRRIRS